VALQTGNVLAAVQLSAVIRCAALRPDGAGEHVGHRDSVRAPYPKPRCGRLAGTGRHHKGEDAGRSASASQWGRAFRLDGAERSGDGHGARVVERSGS